MSNKSNFNHKKGVVASLVLSVALALITGVSSFQGMVSAETGSLPTSTSVGVTSVFQARKEDGTLVDSTASALARTHLTKSARYYVRDWFYESAFNHLDSSLQSNSIMATMVGYQTKNGTYVNRMQTSTYLDVSDNTDDDVLFKMDLSAMVSKGSDANAKPGNGSWDQYTYLIKLTDGTKSISLMYVPANAGGFQTATNGYQPSDFGFAADAVKKWPNQPTTERAGLYVMADGQSKLGGLDLDGTFSGITSTETTGDGYGTPIPAFTKYNNGGGDSNIGNDQHCSSYDEYKQVLYYDNSEKAIYADVWTGSGVEKRLIRDLDATGAANGEDTAWGGFDNPSQVRIEVTQKSQHTDGYGGNNCSFIVYTLDGVALDFDGAADNTTEAAEAAIALQADGYQLNEDGSFAGNSTYKNEGRIWYSVRGEAVTIPNTFINKTTGETVALNVVGAYLEAADGTQIAANADGTITVPADDNAYTLVVFGRENGRTSGPMHFTRRAVSEEKYISSVDATGIFTVTDNSGNAPKTSRAQAYGTEGIQVGTFAYIDKYMGGNYWFTVDGADAYDAYWSAPWTLKEAYQEKTLFIPLSHIGDTSTTTHVAKSTALDLSDNTADDAVLDIDLAAYMQNNPMQRFAINGMYRIRLTDGIKYVDLYYRAANASTEGTTYAPTDTKTGITGSFGTATTDTAAGEVFVLTSDSTAVGSAIAVPAFTKDVNGVPKTCISDTRQQIYYDAKAGTLYVLGKDGSKQTALTGWNFADPSSVSIEISYKDTKGDNQFINYSCIVHGIDGMDVAYISNKEPTLTGAYAARKDGTFAGKSSLESTGENISATQGVSVDVLTAAAIDGYTIANTSINGKAATNGMIFEEVGPQTLIVWVTKNGGADDFVYMQTRTIDVTENTNTYAITFDANGVTAENMPASGSVQYGKQITAPTTRPTNAIKTFVGWYKEAACTTEWNFATDVVKADVTLYAKWEDKLVVTFDAQEGECETQSVYVDANGTVVLPEPTRTGYTFNGWYTAATAGEAWSETKPVIESMTLYAQWTINKFTVTFNSNGGTSVASAEVEYNTKVAEPAAPTKNGGKFAGWYLNGVEYDFNAPVTGNITLVAKWTIDEANTYIKSTQVDVADGFILNVTVTKLEQVTYTVNNGEEIVLTPVASGEYYVVSIPMAAKQITDEITIQVGADGVAYTTSILKNLEAVIERYDNQYKKIAAGLIIYADYAQKQFGYEGNGYAASVTTADLSATQEAIKAQEQPSGNTVTGDTNFNGYMGVTLQCEDKINAWVVFQGLTDGYAISVDGKAVTADTTTVAGAIVVVIKDIKVGALNTAHTVAVTSNNNSYSITFSALAYVQGNWNADGNLGGLCKALYYVYSAAAAQ